MTETEGHTYVRMHRISGPVLPLDLHLEAAAVLAAARESEGGRAARTLVKEGPLRITLLGLTAGAGLHEHHAAGPLTFMVLNGLVDLQAGDEKGTLAVGEALVLTAGVQHALLARADSAVLLVLALAEAAAGSEKAEPPPSQP